MVLFLLEHSVRAVTYYGGVNVLQLVSRYAVGVSIDGLIFDICILQLHLHQNNACASYRPKAAINSERLVLFKALNSHRPKG